MAKKSRIVLGLNSGTSADGVDAVACQITGTGLRMRVQLIDRVHRRYPANLRDRLLELMAPAVTHTEEVCRLNGEVGDAFARAARAVVKRAGLKRVDLVGSHGQTVCHLPPRPRKGRSRSSARRTGTLQIGEPAVIAAALGAPVVSQFRQADMAVGGQGAPLVPWTDYILFRHRSRSRVVQNIGGIANLTWLPAGARPEDVIAFDTGPGNMVIDALVRHFTRGRARCDVGGKKAAAGTVHQAILKRLLDRSFFAESPPKSCGREQFGEEWVDEVLERHAGKGLSPDDWVATATALTAASVSLAYALHLAPRCRRYPPMDEIILCGGGAENPTLVRELSAYVSLDGQTQNVAVSTTADYGIPPQAKECVSFAMLATACVDGVCASLPQVTGACRPVVLGQICNPEPRR